MLNKFDDILAPNLCQYSLIILCIIFFSNFLIFDNFVKFLFLTLFLPVFLFTIKVIQIRHDRNRIYKIIKDRISKKGYSKEVFNGKCDSICLLSQAIYISIRFNSIKDLKFFFENRKSQTPNYIIEDENLEKILNNIDVKNYNEGEIVYQQKVKKSLKKTI